MTAVDLRQLKAICVSHPDDIKHWNSLMKRHHYLPFRGLVGQSVRHAVILGDRWLALLGWQAGAFKTKPRDQWIGWSPEKQFQRLHLIAQNSRFCILTSTPNLASRALTLSLRRLPIDIEFLYGHTVFLAETFVDPSRFKGSCYKACGPQSLGFTKGFSRVRHPKSRVTTWQANQSPKEIFVKEITSDAREQMSGDETPQKGDPSPEKKKVDTHQAIVALRKFFKNVPDPRREHGKVYSLQYIMSLRFLAHLCGDPGYKKTIVFARNLKKTDLKRLGAPKDPKTGKYRIPSIGTIHNLCKNIDHVELQKQLNLFHEQYIKVGATTSLDGKYLRGASKRGENAGEQVITVAAMVHDTNIVIDQELVSRESEHDPVKKENEIPATKRLIERTSKHGCTYTSDAMNAGRPTAQLIIDRLCNYMLVIKDNQKTIFDTLKDFKPKNATTQVMTTDDKHGRYEYREYTFFDLEKGKYKGEIDYPGSMTAIRILRKRTNKKTKETTREVSYVLSSLSLEDYTAEELATKVRGHWKIENCLHYVRDVSLGEDANQAYIKSSPIVNSQMNNLTIAIIKLTQHHYKGYSLTDMQTHYSGSVSEAVDLLVKPISRPSSLDSSD